MSMKFLESVELFMRPFILCNCKALKKTSEPLACDNKSIFFP